jgi:membrane protein YdbS with pleckstrin-like domain
MDDRDTVRADETPFDETLPSAVTPVDETAVGDDGPDLQELIGPRRILEPEIQVVWVLKSSISAIILGVISAVGFTVLPVGDAWVGAVVFTAVFLIGALFAILRYRSWCYEVREDSLYLERGVLTRVRTVVPYVRIQHVDARQGPVERVFGLATSVVYTAGSRGADVSIPGLTPGRADDLQARLKQLAIAAEGEDAV